MTKKELKERQERAGDLKKCNKEFIDKIGTETELEYKSHAFIFGAARRAFLEIEKEAKGGAV